MGGEEEVVIQPTDFVPMTSVPRPAKTGAERMRAYRARKRLQQIYESKNNNILSDFDPTTPVLRLAKTAAERMRAYRARKRLQQTYENNKSQCFSSGFIPTTPIPRLAKTAAERMRAYRARKRIQQTYENKKHAKTSAERARAYRQRQREMRFGETSKKRPASGAERTRKYRERKKAELLEYSHHLREKLSMSVNAWDGILIVPDIMLTTGLPSEPAVPCRIDCSDAVARRDAHVEQRSKIRSLVESKRFSDDSDTLEECAATAAEYDGTESEQDAQRVLDIKYESAALCCSVNDTNERSHDPTAVKPSVNVVSDHIPPPVTIKCEPLDSCDTDLGGSTPDKCITTGVTLIDAPVEANSERSIDLKCEPRPLCRVGDGSTEKCAVLDAANDPCCTDFEFEPPLPSAKPPSVHRESKFPSVTIENSQKNVIGERHVFDQTLFISVKNPVDNRFRDKPYSSACDLCSRLCFASDMSPLTEKYMRKFPKKNMEHFSVCTGCRKTLNRNRIPSKSQSYGNDEALTLFFCNSLWQM